MSDETEAIIDFARAFDPGISVTATTNGIHASTSFHYKDGTHGRGLAVDFAAASPERMLDLARHLATARGSLAELFHTPLGFSVKDGKTVPWFVPDHRNHVHVAVTKGTFLVPQQHKPQEDEDDMPDTTTDACVAPSGKGRWVLDRDGAVRSYNFDDKNPIPFHGSVFDYPAEQSKDGRYFVAIQPAGQSDSDGYFITANDGWCGKFKR